MKSFFIQTFGCRVNQAEAFVWSEDLQRHGLEPVRDAFQSDLVIVNSCTLTSRADRDLRNFLRKVERKNPYARVVVTGCYVEKYPQEARKFPPAWLSLSNKEKGFLIERVSPFLPADRSLPVRPFRSRALVKIQDGCDYRCTFCVIPSVRGKSRSVPTAEVINRARAFVKQGYREIILTGINICSYGLDPGAELSFSGLMNEIDNITGLSRFRLSSLDPRFMDEPFLESLAACFKVCPHFHLSLQHGSDRIIKRMGRDISVKDYSRILSSLVKVFPEAALGADIIVGFPGETDEDSNKMYSFLERSPLTYFHVFSYSPRAGTPAASWPQVRDGEKKERSRRFRDLSRRKTMAFRRRFIGKERPAVVVKKSLDRVDVLTDNYLKTSLPAGEVEERSQIRIRITCADEKGLRGNWDSSAGY
ncbi:MAG: tRNA (N(6)-L-threonylcarbamoyladenosine(37)-C(2))-methylthiotransferase MtaB [Candidatus Aminicenantes bacterium]|nr:tRNA (N(6)-L-threonylcarbamoyladenosine(37)-C(2))-methylthiotransferase MtaB [Candidatus Aminicenantes bacterium]